MSLPHAAQRDVCTKDVAHTFLHTPCDWLPIYSMPYHQCSVCTHCYCCCRHAYIAQALDRLLELRLHLCELLQTLRDQHAASAIASGGAGPWQHFKKAFASPGGGCAVDVDVEVRGDAIAVCACIALREKCAQAAAVGACWRTTVYNILLSASIHGSCGCLDCTSHFKYNKAVNFCHMSQCHFWRVLSHPLPATPCTTATLC